MTGLIIKWLVMTVAVVVAARLVPGITVTSWGTAFVAAIVLSFLNAIIRPILVILTLPINILTLGFFTLVINAALLAATGWLLKGQLEVRGFGAAFLGALVISIVSTLLSLFVPHGDR